MTEELLADLARSDPRLAAELRLGGGQDSGLALRFRVDELDRVAVLELVRSRRVGYVLDLSAGELLADLDESDVLAVRVTARDDTVDDSVARAEATAASLDLGLPLAEVYSAGARWHVPPRNRTPKGEGPR